MCSPLDRGCYRFYFSSIPISSTRCLTIRQTFYPSSWPSTLLADVIPFSTWYVPNLRSLHLGDTTLRVWLQFGRPSCSVVNCPMESICRHLIKYLQLFCIIGKMVLLAPMSPGYSWSPWTSWSTAQYRGPAHLLWLLVPGPGPYSPHPGCLCSTLPVSWCSRILTLTPLSHLESFSHIPSTPGPLPPSAQSHSDLLRSSPSLPVYVFLISITFSSFLPHLHVTWSFYFPSTCSPYPSLHDSCHSWFLLMISYLSY